MKTVADLILALQALPQDAPILIRDSVHDCNYEIYSVCSPGEYDDDPDAVVLWDGE
jgi:hypothetical protein